MTDTAGTRNRSPISRERVLRAAIALADRSGIEAVSMRRLAQELGVEAMGLYRRVRDKNDLVDGAIDAVIAEIEVGKPVDDWRAAMRELAMAARRVMLRHAWAPRVISDRHTVGPSTLRHIDRVLSILERGGFSIDLAHHALHVLSSRMLGFTQVLFDESPQAPSDSPPAEEVARALAAYPSVARLAVAARHDGVLGPCDDNFEFEFGLDLILEGLETRRVAGQSSATSASPRGPRSTI